jgi:GNAT superfamily N-acetyltransferase
MEFIIRRMDREDWPEVGELIYTSINYWYHTHGSGPKFLNGPESTQLFCKIYEDLDPGCCILVENPNTGRIAGSCFFHPRETHISIGIMNVHPNYFGLGAAKVIMREILDIAAKEEKPVRLVSSAMNLDSFTLYNRYGFTPRQIFQDMYMEVPSSGLNVDAPALSGRVRDAQPEDVPAIADLEMELVGIRRPIQPATSWAPALPGPRIRPWPCSTRNSITMPGAALCSSCPLIAANWLTTFMGGVHEIVKSTFPRHWANGNHKQELSCPRSCRRPDRPRVSPVAA